MFRRKEFTMTSQSVSYLPKRSTPNRRIDRFGKVHFLGSVCPVADNLLDCNTLRQRHSIDLKGILDPYCRGHVLFKCLAPYRRIGMVGRMNHLGNSCLVIHGISSSSFVRVPNSLHCGGANFFAH